MKYKFEKGNKVNLGRTSHRKGKSMVEEYGKEKAEKLKKIIREKQKGKHHFKKEMKCDNCNKEFTSFTSIQKYCKKCRQDLYNLKYYKNNHKKCLTRAKTKSMFGKLEKGYEYHHYTEPYEYDKFFILEKGLHKWMHGHPKSFKLGGLIN